MQSISEDPALAAVWRIPFLPGLPSLSLSPTFPSLLLHVFYITFLQRDGVFPLRDLSMRLDFGLSGFGCLTKGKRSMDVTDDCSL